MTDTEIRLRKLAIIEQHYDRVYLDTLLTIALGALPIVLLFCIGRLDAIVKALEGGDFLLLCAAMVFGVTRYLKVHEEYLKKQISTPRKQSGQELLKHFKQTLKHSRIGTISVIVFSAIYSAIKVSTVVSPDENLNSFAFTLISVSSLFTASVWIFYLELKIYYQTMSAEFGV